MKIDIGKNFIWVEPLKLEISWWNHNCMGIFLYPAISLSSTGNTRGFQIRFLRYAIDFSYYLNK